MPSYKLIPFEQDKLDSDILEERIETLLGNRSSQSPKRGIIPDSYGGRAEYDLYWAVFGWEKQGTRRTWDGEVEYSYVEPHLIIFIQNGYIAHEKANKDVTLAIRSSIQTILDSDYALEPITFEPDDLVAVVDSADSVQRLDVSPTAQQEPDHLSASDRKDVRETKFVEDYEGEPFEKVKFSVPGEEVDVKVDFQKDGTVILHGRNMESLVQAQALRFLTEELIKGVSDPLDFQWNLSRF